MKRLYLLLLLLIAVITPISHAQSCGSISFPYTVPAGDVTALRGAIICANGNSTADVIDLGGATFTMTDAPYAYDGATGLPSISSEITIQNGTIERDTDVTIKFRLLYITDTGNLRLEGVSLHGGSNNTSGYGGAIYNSGMLIVLNSIISGNYGNIYNHYAIAIIVQSVISGNYNPIISHYSNTTIIQSTISGNRGGIDIYYGQASMFNTIIADNFTNDLSVSVATITIQHSMVGGFGTNDVFGGNNLVSVITPLQVDPINPLTSPNTLGNYRLLPESPAVDTGSNLLAVDNMGNALTTDLDGNPRIFDGRVDMGAYESQYLPDCAGYNFPYRLGTVNANPTEDLHDAMLCANQNSTADTIDLNNNLINPYDNDVVLPPITSTITLRNGIIENGINEDPQNIIVVPPTLYVLPDGDLTLINIVMQNSRHLWNNRVIVNNGGNVVTEACMIRGNRTGPAPVFNLEGTTHITNSLLTGNVAEEGSAIVSFFGTVNITHSTISGNIAEYDSASVYNYLNTSTVNIKNSIIYGNQGGDISGHFTLEYSLIGTYTEAWTGLGGSIINVGPQFIDSVDFADVPTTGGDYRLQAGSPAINTGRNGIALGYSLTTDLLGVQRIIGTRVDMGAYEYFDADVDNDNLISPVDAVFVTNRIGLSPTGSDAPADVDLDGDIDNDDALAVLLSLGLMP